MYERKMGLGYYTQHVINKFKTMNIVFPTPFEIPLSHYKRVCAHARERVIYRFLSSTMEFVGVFKTQL